MEFQAELESLYKQASELRSKGQSVESELLEIKAAGILQKLKNHIEQAPDDPSIAAELLYLAEREWAILGDDESVLAKIERARALCEKQLGPHDPLTAEAMAKLAEFHYLAGRFEVAEPLYRRSVDIFASSKGLEGLAQTLAVLGRHAEADPYFARAIEEAGRDEQGIRSLYFLLIYRAEGLEKLNRPGEAAALRQKAAELLPKANPGEFGYRAS